METPKTVREVLLAARELIAKGWTRETDARDVHGNPVGYLREAAVCWCSASALQRAAGGVHGALYASAVLAVRKAAGFHDQGGGYGIVDWNDAPERTQTEVLDAFTKAAEMAQ